MLLGRRLYRRTTLVSFSFTRVAFCSVDLQTIAAFKYPFTENSALNKTLTQYELPVVLHSTIDSDGYGDFLCSHSSLSVC